MERLSGFPKQERIRVQAYLERLAALSTNPPPLVRRRHSVEATDHSERQDDVTVLGLLVVTTQQVSDRPGVSRDTR